MGHPNQGLKPHQTCKTRLGIWVESSPGAVPTSKLGCPKPLQVRKAQATLGPQPSTMVRPLRCLAGCGAISALLEDSPPRPLEAKAISASLETPSAEPPVGPRHGRKLRLAQDHPRQTGAAAQPPDGIGRINSPTTPRHGAGLRWCRAASAGVGHHVATADVTGVPSAYARHYAAIPGAG